MKLLLHHTLLATSMILKGGKGGFHLLSIPQHLCPSTTTVLARHPFFQKSHLPGSRDSSLLKVLPPLEALLVTDLDCLFMKMKISLTLIRIAKKLNLMELKRLYQQTPLRSETLEEAFC